MRSPVKIQERQRNLMIPIFLELLLIMMLGITDTVMLSQYSDNKVASVGVVNQLINMVNLLFGVTTLGTSVLCSQYLGATDHTSSRQVIGVSLLFNAVVGMAVGLSLLMGGRAILELMKIRPELMPDALDYMAIVGGFSVVQALSMTLSAILRSYHLAQYSLRVTLLMNLINVVGNYALIFGNLGCPELGVKGAAIATTFSRMVALTLFIYYLFRKAVPGFSFRSVWPFPLQKLKQILSVGIPSAGEQISYSVSQVVILYFINMLGNEAITARTYAMNLIMFSFLYSLAMAHAGAICVGHLVGEGRFRMAYKLALKNTRRAMMVSFAMALFFALTGPLLIGLFTENSSIIAMCSAVLWVELILEPGRAVNLVVIFSLRAAGDTRYPVLMGMLPIWLIATAGSWFFGIYLHLGLLGMWVAFAADEAIRGVMMLKRWHKKRWEKMSFVKQSTHFIDSV